MKKISTYLFIVNLLCSSIMQAQTVSELDDLTLYPGSYWDGSDMSGGFQNGNVWFTNSYDTTYSYWSGGFVYSNVNDSSTSGYGNLYAVKAFTDYSGSGNYALGSQAAVLKLTGNAAGKVVNGAYFTNSTYAANSMRDGDSFAKKFGGTTGNDPDWFKLTVFGFTNGSMTTDSVEFFLADYRSANNADDYIVDSWEWVDLSPLGNVDSLIFFMSSTDNGSWGMNTPAYFALDNFTTADSPDQIKEITREKNNIYPNPSKSYIMIDVNVKSSVSIYSINGELLYNEMNEAGNSIDISNFTKGIYLVKIEGDKTFSTHKLIVE